MIDHKCTTTRNGDPFVDTTDLILTFPFDDAYDIQEISFIFDGGEVGQIAELELLNTDETTAPTMPPEQMPQSEQLVFHIQCALKLGAYKL